MQAGKPGTSGRQGSGTLDTSLASIAPIARIRPGPAAPTWGLGYVSEFVGREGSSMIPWVPGHSPARFSQYGTTRST